MNPTSIEQGLAFRHRRARLVLAVLLVFAVSLCLATLMFGKQSYSMETIVRVLLGENVPKASFSIRSIRLPKMLAGFAVGFSLALAGNTFQTLLRNSLASPDVIGISASTSAAGVFCILVLDMSGMSVSIAATVFGIVVAALIYLLARGQVFNSNRLILIGIGAQTMMSALINFIVLHADEYDIPQAMRWLNGSLNGVQMKSIPALVGVALVFGCVILALENDLKMMELGEELSVTLGVRANRVRLLLIVSSVFLIAFSTSVTGPIAFVAFLSGPIAKRLVGTGNKNLAISGLIGACLVLLSELIGQFALEYRYPVGVITGILGAPYLLVLLVKMNKKGGA